MKLIIIILFGISVFAVELIVSVPDLPSDESLEVYETNEEIFIEKLMEYYNIAKALKTQVEFYKIKPVEELKVLSFENISSLDRKIIESYFDLAKKYEEQIKQIPNSHEKEKLIQLERKLIEKDLEMIDTVWHLNSFYLQREIEIKEESNAKLMQIRKSLDKDYADYFYYFSVAVIQSLFIPDFDHSLNAEPNSAFKIYFNALKLFEFGGRVSFWYEYNAPRFTTDFNTPNGTTEFRWNTDLSAVGISGDFYPIKIKNVKNGVKAGLGYFWTSGDIYNQPGGYYDWEGLKIDLEYFIGVKSSKYPLKVFLGLSLYQSINSNLNFSYQDQRITLGRTHAGLNVGIRYDFWSQSF